MAATTPIPMPANKLALFETTDPSLVVFMNTKNMAMTCGLYVVLLFLSSAISAYICNALTQGEYPLVIFLFALPTPIIFSFIAVIATILVCKNKLWVIWGERKDVEAAAAARNREYIEIDKGKDQVATSQ